MLWDTINYITLLYRLYRVCKHDSDENVNKLMNITYKSGCIAIKFIQFISMNDSLLPKSIGGKLKGVYEDCKIHDMKHTEKLYTDTFGTNFHDDYIYTGEIHSGSIGQVYKAYQRSSGQCVAIKVKHPGIDEQVIRLINTFSRIVNFVGFFVRVPFVYLVHEFITNIQMQLNFEQEASNTETLHQLWKNEPRIIIPHVLQKSKDIIVMTYHAGIPANTITDPRKKVIASLYLSLFTITSILIHDYIHCDMHYGNWKLDMTDDNECANIIIYDCGIIAQSLNKEGAKTIIGCLFGSNFEAIGRILIDEKYAITEPVKIKLYDEFVKSIKVDESMTACGKLQEQLRYIVETGIKTNPNIMRILQAFVISGDDVAYLVEKINTMIGRGTATHTIIMQYAYACVAHNSGSFKQLARYLMDWIKETDNHAAVFEEWLDDRFGHSDVDVFNEVLCEMIGLNYTPLSLA